MEFKIITDLAPFEALEIQTNAAEIEKEIAEKVSIYEKMVVTPETKAAAKQDLANLRKVVGAIDQTYTTARAILLRPAEGLKSQRERLKNIVNGAIDNLDTQVKRFDEQERQEKLGKLREFFDKQNAKAYGVAEWDKIAARHPDWKNKGCTEDKAKSDILTEFAGIERDLQAIYSPAYEPYRAMMIEKYCERYNLADAINVYTQIKRREAMEAEWKKREEEEARAAAERKLMEAEAERQRRQIAAETAQALNREFTRAETETPTAAEDGGDAPIQTATAVKRVEFWVQVTSEQAKALGNFLRENGIMYGAVKREG